MITPWDESYKRTKAIKSGAAKLEPPFSDLVDWINDFYADIGALNAWVDEDVKGIQGGKPALRIAFERDAAVARLTLGLNFNPAEQARIVAQFRVLARQARMGLLDGSMMFATFHAFEPLARWEANNAVSAEEIAHLKTALGAFNVWEIHRQADHVTFFFATDDQLAASTASGARAACEQAYRLVLARYDTLGHFAERPMEPAFSSKQSFDRDYKGSWFNFDR